MDGQTDRWMNGWIDRQTDGRRADECMDRQTDRQKKDERTDGQTDILINRQERWTEEQMDGQTDR